MVLGAALSRHVELGRKLKGGITHLVGGLIFGTAAADLMPAASQSGDVWALAIGFCVGFILMLTINSLWGDQPAPRMGRIQVAALLLPFLVDSVIDGLVVGISSSAGKHSWIIPTAISLEMGLSALGLSILLKPYGHRWISSLTGVTMALSYGVGLGISALLHLWLKGPALTGLLAFGTAALIYLVVEEVMKEAHAPGEDDSGPVSVCFFIGVLAVWLLETSGH